MTRQTRTIALVTALTAAFVAASVSRAATATSQHRPKTPIEHFVTVLQENHTYDNYFGTYPRGNGFPAHVCVPIDPQKPRRGCVRPFHLGSNRVVPADPAHSTATARQQFNRGRMNGFVSALDRVNQDGRLTMGYRNGRDLPYYWNLAGQYVLYDRFFSSAMADNFINHLFWVTGGPSASRPFRAAPSSGMRCHWAEVAPSRRSSTVSTSAGVSVEVLRPGLQPQADLQDVQALSRQPRLSGGAGSPPQHASLPEEPRAPLAHRAARPVLRGSARQQAAGGLVHRALRPDRASTLGVSARARPLCAR